jgi:tellurite resistance protein
MLSRLLGRVALSHGLPHAVARIPGLRRLPVLKLVAVAELALVARRHLQHLDSAERRRLAELLRHGRGLSTAEREELRRLVAKLDARAFAGSVMQRLSPVPVPRRLTRVRY